MALSSAGLPWQAYIMGVRRVRKPFGLNADYSELFLFDEHYTMPALYCQQIRYNGQFAILRTVGSHCPSKG